MLNRIVRFLVRGGTAPRAPRPAPARPATPRGTAATHLAAVAPPRPRPTPSARVYGADEIALVGFDGTARVLCPPQSAFSAVLQTVVRELPAAARGQSTSVGAGLAAGLDLLEGVAPGRLRRLWLLTDGLVNREEERVLPLVARAKASYVNVNTVLFGEGDKGNGDLLRQIAAGTHRGRSLTVADLRSLAAALVTQRPGWKAQASTARHRAETTVVAVDLSASMNEPFDGTTKIQAVGRALFELLLWKQRTFA